MNNKFKDREFDKKSIPVDILNKAGINVFIKSNPQKRFVQQKKENLSNISLVNKYLEKKALVLKSNQTIDLYQMSCQYGFNIVKNAIELCYDNLIKLLEVEKINIGGYIRSVIKNEFGALISKL